MEGAKVKFCPGRPNFPGCCAVYIGFGIFEYQLWPIFAVTSFYKGVFKHFQGVPLLG
jgi:hypothetical protein